MKQRTRSLTPAERERLGSFERRQASRRGQAGRGPFSGAVKGLAYGAGFSLVMFLVWREFVWEAFLGFSFVGGLLGSMFGAPFNSAHQARRSQSELALEAMLSSGEVEECEYEVSGALALRDDDEDAWFLQVHVSQLLCLWDPEEVRERLTVVCARHGDATQVLSQRWSGQEVKPSGPRRAFRVGEYRPKPGELLAGTLELLDATLRELGPQRPPTSTRAVAPLAQAVEALGFYKFVGPELIEAAKAEFDVDPEAWLLAAGRSFAADAELLSEGGVAALLEVMQPALARERVALGEVSEWYREGAGVSLKVGSADHTLWSAGEPKPLLVTRLQGLINGWLEAASSAERLFVRGERLVLLTPTLRERLAGIS